MSVEGPGGHFALLRGSDQPCENRAGVQPQKMERIGSEGRKEPENAVMGQRSKKGQKGAAVELLVC